MQIPSMDKMIETGVDIDEPDKVATVYPDNLCI